MHTHTNTHLFISLSFRPIVPFLLKIFIEKSQNLIIQQQLYSSRLWQVTLLFCFFWLRCSWTLTVSTSEGWRVMVPWYFTLMLSDEVNSVYMSYYVFAAAAVGWKSKLSFSGHVSKGFLRSLCVQLRRLHHITGKSLPNMKRMAKIATLPALTFTSSFSGITHVARSTLVGSW